MTMNDSRMESGASFKTGIVSQIKLGFIRATLPDMDDLETDWLPVLVFGDTQNNKSFAMPSVGAQVALLLDGRCEDGVCLGTVYSDVDTPTAPNERTVHTTFSDGAVLEYDPTTSKLLFTGSKEIEVVGENIQVTGKDTMVKTDTATIDSQTTTVKAQTASIEASSTTVKSDTATIDSPSTSVTGNLAVAGVVNAAGYGMGGNAVTGKARFVGDIEHIGDYDQQGNYTQTGGKVSSNGVVLDEHTHDIEKDDETDKPNQT